MNWLGKQLSIEKEEDWYRVSLKQVRSVSPTTLFKKHSFFTVLSNVYPSHSWDVSKLDNVKNQKPAQRLLITVLRSIFPSSEVKEDYLHPNMRLSSGLFVQLDIFMVKEKIALEYQGEHHFQDVLGAMNHKTSEMDQMKQKLCDQNDITLIQIPYWWDKQSKSLQEAIYNKRPDVLSLIHI
eukprot:TRINITY_DN2547_c0_g1_i1.p2 TRINITY_DN2547_c0_g1~~TRINITY_DN2547_c0_g1_i1.p2  ORF type:complete len:181 (-),score=37.64 TRINITY_DN2547_c0_g1_i1:46-588(-)